MTTKPTRKRRAFVACAAALCLILNLFGHTAASAAEPIDEVNVMIGTTGPSVYDYGGMIPGVTVPFGMTHWTAQTRENKISVYSYNHKDETIQGFIGTHQPAIWMGDYGQVSLMPFSGELKTPAPRLPFRHEDETAAPNYYSVKMGEPGSQIFSELTATARAGLGRLARRRHGLQVGGEGRRRVRAGQRRGAGDCRLQPRPDVGAPRAAAP
jgi:putative alpha-1,2-mannosidase